MPQLGRRAARLAAAVAIVAGVVLPAGPAFAADPPGAPLTVAAPLTVDARVMLQGHTRAGAWMAIDVRIRNDGPAVVGELRLNGGAQGRTRFATPVDVPTTSDKHYRIYAQPPAFGGELDITLVADGQTLATRTVAFTVHDPAQLVVGVVAERPQPLLGSINLLPDQNGAAAAIVALAPADLPDRVEAWAALDRLVWQDVDTTQLSPEQVASLRGWLAAGGRLVVVGGTANPSVLSALPDDVLPYRPEATIDVPSSALVGLLGSLPNGATDVPGLSGSLARGRTLATVGDRVVAAEAVYGSGAVAIVGIDPTVAWIADSVSAGAGFWRRLLPPRTTTVVVGSDDSQVVSAASRLPALALPPIGGLLVLFAGYIVLIGPANYFVLRRLDRREWAWVTMPVLIAVFAVGAYAYGIALRGLDVVINEVAIVRGAPDAEEGTAQVYLGVFSPSQGTYQLDLPGGALIASTLTGDFATGSTAPLDIVQGNPSRVRNLTVGFGSLRTLRAETPAAVPRIRTDLRLADGMLVGTVRNLSDQVLERPAIVLGGSVVVLADLAPGGEQSVALPIKPNPFDQSLADRILGPLFFGDPSRGDDTTRRDEARHYVIEQLTFDPTFSSIGRLPSEGPVLLAWGSRQVLDVRVDGLVPRRTGNVLYYIPLDMAIDGRTTFEADLLRSSIVEIDSLFFSKDPYSMHVGSGSVTIAYRPIAFTGSLEPRRVLLSMGFGDRQGLDGGPPVPIEPTTGPEPPAEGAPPGQPAPDEPACDPNTEDCVGAAGLPEVEVHDRTGNGGWVRLPHFSVGTVYELADPVRYVDPSTGAILVRFSDEDQDGSSFSFQIRIEGQVE